MRAVLLALALASVPALARDLPVPPGKGWQHAATGLILRPTLAGLPRTALTDSTSGEWDVTAQFGDAALGEATTIYLFHAATPEVGIWFDRADWQVVHRKSFGGATPLGAPLAFAPPGTTIPAGLRRSYSPNKAPYRSTALALLPLGPWLLAIRTSSTTLDPAALDARLTATIAGLGWPKDAPAPLPAQLVAPCAAPLAFRKARLRKPDFAQAIMSSLMALPAAMGSGAKSDPAAKPWCRDGDGTEPYGVYHREGVSDGYTLALGDAGRTAQVYGSTAITALPGTGGYPVLAVNVDGTAATFPSFDALPRPEQVVKLVTGTAPMSSTSAAGKQVNINVNGGLKN